MNLIFLNFLFINEHIALNKTYINFIHKHLEKEFNENKKFYKGLFTELFNKFEKNSFSFEIKIQYILFIKEYFKKNNRILNEEIFI